MTLVWLLVKRCYFGRKHFDFGKWVLILLKGFCHNLLDWVRGCFGKNDFILVQWLWFFGKRVLFLVKTFSFWEKDFGKTFVFVGFDFGKRVLILVKRHWLGYRAFDFAQRISHQKIYVRQKSFSFGFKKSDFGKSFFVTRLLTELLQAAG